MKIYEALEDAGAEESDWAELYKWKAIEDVDGVYGSALTTLNQRDFQDCINFVKHIKAKRSK